MRSSAEMNAIRVAVVNWSGMPDSEVLAGTIALQQQLDEDFAPAWHIDAILVQWPGWLRGPGYWGLVLLNNRIPATAGQAHEALGIYGHLTSYRYPLARVFVDQVAPDQSWTHLASHQLLEMLVDPYRTAAVYREDGQPYRVFARRVCDPCHLDSYYKDGHTVSNFVRP